MGLPRAELHSQALQGSPSGPEATWNASSPSPGTSEDILSAGTWCAKDGQPQHLPILARGSKPSLTPAPTTARAPNLQTGGPGSAAGGAHPPSSWVCRDNQAGHGGDETWGSEALRTVKEEG